MKRKYLAPCLILGLLAQPAWAQRVDVELTLPNIASSQYKRPFTAIWIEKTGQRAGNTTLAVWYDEKKWLKDIRRWWRKTGRYDDALDAVTGATKPPGKYQVSWESKDAQGNALEGEYVLYLEAVREHGNRTLLKQKIQFGAGAQTYHLKAGDELGPVKIIVGE